MPTRRAFVVSPLVHGWCGLVADQDAATHSGDGLRSDDLGEVVLLEQERSGVGEDVQGLARVGDELVPNRVGDGGSGQVQFEEFGHAGGLG